jgi:hypothetical protein
MPNPVVYTPVQPQPSIVHQPVIWTPNSWVGLATCPPPSGPPEIWTVSVTNFTPVISPSPMNADPGLIITLTGAGSVTGLPGATLTGTYIGAQVATLTVTGTYTDYMFPNKEYVYRNDDPNLSVTHTQEIDTNTKYVGGEDGGAGTYVPYSANYYTLNQETAALRTTALNPVGGQPIAGVTPNGMIGEITTPNQYIKYEPDPRFMVIATYTVVITSSCGVGAGTFSITQIVYDDKDIAAKMFMQQVKAQKGRTYQFGD